MPWKEKLLGDLAMTDLDAMAARARRASADTVGLVHPVHGASVTVDDEGRIDLFTFGPVGIRIDPRSGSVNIYAAKVTINGKEVDLGRFFSS